MILDVAGDVVVLLALAAQVGGLELGDDLLVRAVDDVRDRAEPAAMGHAEHGRPDPFVGELADDLLEHRDHHVEPLDREGLLADVRLAQVALHRLDFGQPREHGDRLGRAQRDAMPAGLDVLAQPLALLDVRDVLDFVGDRRRIRLAQLRQHLGERAAGDLRAQHGSRDRGHQRRREPVGARVERGIAGRFGAERIERRGEVAVAPVRRQQRHPGGDGAQQFVGVTGVLARNLDRRSGGARRRDRAPLRVAHVQAERRKDAFVEVVAAVEQFLDAPQVLA